ncbi:hypothetical protein ACFRFH_12885 [Leifsonia sp. NPDC056824]|uniref:hypothetical protein n=1 Tax=Leifsonia sp. NPDC056824 TaxID=3345953 RepID=UPI0036966BAF
MTDRQDTPEPPESREHELRDRVSGLGDTPEDALEEIESRNDSLEERLPDEELPHSEGAPGQG